LQDREAPPAMTPLRRLPPGGNAGSAAELRAVLRSAASPEALRGALRERLGATRVQLFASGREALRAALGALASRSGRREVIVPAYTFPATANAVELCGGRAVLVDVDADTFLAGAEHVAAAVTPRTRAVLAVHLFGRPLPWEELQTAVPQEVALVEDAAGALGARYRGTPCGALGLLGCLSFHPRKIVTTGEGGAVTTDDAALAASVRRLRHHGIVSGDGVDIPTPGLNYRLPDVLCALGIPQLERLESLLRARERVAGWYAERLEHLVHEVLRAAVERARVQQRRAARQEREAAGRDRRHARVEHGRALRAAFERNELIRRPAVGSDQMTAMTTTAIRTMPVRRT